MSDDLTMEGVPRDTQGELRIPCEVYSRVVGYLRLVQAWNIGKRQEFEDRVPFDVKEQRAKVHD